MKLDPYMVVLDIESWGLHGGALAAGWVVVNNKGEEAAEGLIWCNAYPGNAAKEDTEWVHNNIPLLDPRAKCFSPKDMRNRFWNIWRMWKGQGCSLWVDCGWPVEDRFLAKCVDDDLENRKWDGPYPLHEIATLRAIAGFDPLGTFERRDNELPQHNPLHDARQSARLLVEAIQRINAWHEAYEG
jgi:hypothetical protein